MVSGSRIEGGPQVLSAGVRRTIQSIKEVFGSHSDADIYVALKEANMDPNETAHKLLIQDPFHEVKRKRDRKKENSGHKIPVGPDVPKYSEITHVPPRNTTNSDRVARRGVFGRNVPSDAGAIQEFRVVRDNRVNQNAVSETKPAQSSVSKTDGVISEGYVKSHSLRNSGHQKPLFKPASDSRPKKPEDIVADVNERKEILEEKRRVPNATSQVQAKSNGLLQHPRHSSSSNVVGVYSFSASDPVHVPSLHSRPASNVGAIRREVGAVGHHRHGADYPSKLPQSNASSVTQPGHGPHSRESTRPLSAASGVEQLTKNVMSETGVPVITSSRSSNNQYSSRSHQAMGHQKASQPNMEWKPKSTLKHSSGTHGIIGSSAEGHSPSGKSSEESKKESNELQGNLSQLRLSENQNVIIAPHIRVSDTDRFRLTFGSLDAGSDSSGNSSGVTIDGAEKFSVESTKSATALVPESSGVGSPLSKQQLDTNNERPQNSGSVSPDSFSVSDNNQLIEKKEVPGSQNLDNYVDVGLVHNNSRPYTPQLHQEENDLPSFSGYETQMGYDSYFHPIVDDAIRVPGMMPSSQEVLSSHAASSLPSSSIGMLQQQQQQQQMTQMYPQLHVSHFANLMPYRQFLSPVYVPPPMPVPAGYSNNPAYHHHPSNGNSFMLMPSNNSHLTPSAGLKYGVQQFNPVPAAAAANPNGLFGNIPNRTVGYAINSSGVVGSAAGHEDSSRLKYKENLYVPNPQPETSEIWMNPRDISGLQSASYYSMPGQTPHPAYLTSHSGHASFNAAVVAQQSSHMQFPAAAVYHHHASPQQPAAIPNAQIGVAAAAASPQVGAAAYHHQQGHVNWGGNF